MRLSRTFKFTLLAAAIAAMALAPAAHAVKSNGKKVGVKVTCAGAAGATTPGGADGVYQGGPYDGVYGPYGPPGSTPGAGCNGRITLKIGKKKAGKAIFNLARGQRKTVVVRLSRPARKLLFANGRLKVKLQITSSAAVAAPRRLTIKPKVKRKPKA
jgi:hypothetical protein